MRWTAWIGSGSTLRVSLLGISLGAALSGLAVLGGAGDALAQDGVTNMGGAGNRSGHAVAARRNAARPGPAMKGPQKHPAPIAKGHGFRPAPTPHMKGYGYRPAPHMKGHRRHHLGPRVQGYYYRPVPLAGAYGYRPVRHLRRHAYRPHGYYYRSTVAPRSCGEYGYWSSAKGRCLDARTTAPSLHPQGGLGRVP